MTTLPHRVVVALLTIAGYGYAQGVPPVSPAQTPAGIVRTPLLDNDAVTLTRIRFEPGARETPHTHPFTLVIVQLTRGELDFMKGDARRTSLVDPGHVELVPRDVTHAAANASTASWEVMAVAVKGHGPFPHGDNPESQSTTLMAEHADARATLAIYTPAAAGALMAIASSSVLIPLMPARIEVQLGQERATELYQPGEAIFLPRNVPHAIRDAGSAPFTAVLVEFP